MVVLATSMALFAIGANASLLFVRLTASRGLYRTRVLLSASKQINGVVSAWISVLLIVTALLFLLSGVVIWEAAGRLIGAHAHPVEATVWHSS